MIDFHIGLVDFIDVLIEEVLTFHFQFNGLVSGHGDIDESEDFLYYGLLLVEVGCASHHDVFLEFVLLVEFLYNF